MSDRVYGQDEKQKLERLVNEGAQVMQEVEDLNTGLKDTVKAVAEELNIKPATNNQHQQQQVHISQIQSNMDNYQ